ncbi:MAG: hypothetical protein Q8L48_25210 [Archangium sp.]|nr:hypothetical protein [Archangium sp.]
MLIHRAGGADGIESIAPAAVDELSGLGLQLDGPGVALTAWWGTNEPRTIYEPRARLVSRLDLARRLRELAASLGTEMIEDVRHASVSRAGGAFDVMTSGGGTDHQLVVRSVVDATGRAASVARRLGAQRYQADELFSAVVDVVTAADGVWTEATSPGWWSLCGLAGRGTLAFHGNLAEVRAAATDLGARVRETRLGAQVEDLIGAVVVRASGSELCLPSAGPGWVAVGDAAMSVQPLASAGNAKALRDAARVFEAFNRPAAFSARQNGEFHRYLDTLARQYREGGRRRTA